MAVLMVQAARRGPTSTNRTRIIMCLSLFWHFPGCDLILRIHCCLSDGAMVSFYRERRRIPRQRKNVHDRLYPVGYHPDGYSILMVMIGAASPAVIL